jgi:hypothetical protein
VHVWGFVCGVGLLVASAVAIAQGKVPIAAQSCKLLRPESEGEQHVLIEQSGCYTLGQTFDQRWLFILSEGGRRAPGDREIIETLAQDTEIDLAGLSLKTSTGIDGIVASPGKYERRFIPLSPGEFHRFVVRNGEINLHNDDFNKSGIGGRGVVAPTDATFVHDRYGEKSQIPPRFRKVEYILENLTIKTGNAAALLMGDGVVVRNCTIEVEGENALVIYGPNARIENNRIVYRYRDADSAFSSWMKPRDPPPYPDLRSVIYLRAADNAIVRGNTIHVSRWDRPVSAVAVVDSKGVLVEGNQFNTDVTPVVLNGASTATLRRNRIEGGLFDKAQPLADAELR